jgi:hypothetical protein
VQPSPGACTVSASTAVIPITVRPLPEPVFVDPPAGMCPNSAATLTVDGAGSGGSYCFTYECTDCVHNPYLTGNDEQAASGCYWYSECIYGEANTYTVALPDAGSLTVWVRAMTEYGCVDSTSIVLGELPVFSAGSITTANILTVTGVAPATNPANAETASGGDGNITYEWRRSGTSSATLIGSNSPGYTLSSVPGNYDTEGAYTFTRYAKDGSCNTTFTASGGQYTLTVIDTPPGAGTYTLTCGTRIWSGVLRNDVASCAAVSSLNTSNPPPAQYLERGGTYGYYYNWTCVNDAKDELCPSPWRVPSGSDYNALTSCTTANVIDSQWPLNGVYTSASSAAFTGWRYYWTSDSSSTIKGCFSRDKGSGDRGIWCDDKSWGMQIRCVR